MEDFRGFQITKEKRIFANASSNNKNTIGIMIMIIFFQIICLDIPLALGTASLHLPLVLNNWVAESGPDSETLIDQAVAAGLLDNETALIYKVYAVFGDSRLPSQYLGDNAVALDSLVLSEVRSRWATLSPQAQAILEPFLLPPTQAGSYEQQGLSKASGGGPLGSLVEWQTEDAASGVRIWYQTRFMNDDLKAKGLAQAIDNTIYPKLMAAMDNHKWLGDGGQGNVNGGDDRLDIYLVSKLEKPAVTIPYNGYKNTPAFIFLKRDRALGDDTHFGLVHILAHEMMHAVQFSFNWKEYFDNYIWLAEATANWFMDFAYPKVNVEHRAARRFLNTPSLSLEDLTNKRQYGSYLLPFYLTHQYGTVGFISSIWTNTEAFDSLSAIDLAIPGGFEAIWPEFVRYNWNKKPQDEEYQWDGLPYGAYSVTDPVPLGTLPLPVELKHLSAQYYRLTFSDDNIRSVIFYNGLTFKLAEGEVPHVWPNTKKYYPQVLTPEEMKGIGIHALIKVAGQDWKWEDWSYELSKGFCRDAKAERLEELVLIFSNSEFDQSSPNYLLKPRGLNPLLLTSDMGCWQWKGTVNRTQAFLPGVTETWTSTVTFERMTDGLPEDQDYQVKEGSTQWAIHGQWFVPGYGGTTYEGSTNVTLQPQNGTLITYNSHTGGSLYRALFGIGTCDGTLPHTITLPDGTIIHDEMPGCIWLETNTGTDLPPKVTSGTVADGTYWDGILSTSTWHLEAQREP